MTNQMQPLRVTHVSASSTITTGGTAQSAVTANANRVYLLVQNPKTETETLFVSMSGTATSTGTSIGLERGEKLIFDHAVPIGAVSVIAATTGHKFVVAHS